MPVWHIPTGPKLPTSYLLLWAIQSDAEMDRKPKFKLKTIFLMNYKNLRASNKI